MSPERRAAVDEEMEGINGTGQKSTPSPSLWAALGSPPHEGGRRGLMGVTNDGCADSAEGGPHGRQWEPRGSGEAALTQLSSGGQRMEGQGRRR